MDADLSSATGPAAASIASGGGVVIREYNAVPIAQRADGYINATAMCKAAGKEWKHYRENASTSGFLEALSGSVGIPTDLLVVSIVTGPNEQRGTWVHPQVAYHLAQWCSPAFAVQVSAWIHDIRTKGYATAPGVGAGPAARLVDGLVAEQGALVFRSYHSIATLIGLDTNQAALAAARAVRTITGQDPLATMGVTHLLAPQQEDHLTPTDIGIRLGGLSAVMVNGLLHEQGFQTSWRDEKKRLHWEPSEQGQPYAVWLDTGKKHGDGSPVRQLRWSAGILAVLKADQAVH